MLIINKRLALLILCFLLFGCMEPPPYKLYGVAEPAVVAPEESFYTRIWFADDLEQVRTNPSGSFILMRDIDLSAYSSGSGWKPLPTFRGIFNGNGHKITGLKIVSDDDFIGFFKQVRGGVVKNLIIENADITGAMPRSGNLSRIGVIAWQLKGSVIDNCTVSGVIRGWNGGGIANVMFDSVVTDTVSDVTIHARRGGGIIGAAYSSRITSSCAYGDIDGMFGSGGGIAGTLYNSLVEESCYCGNISISDYASYGYNKSSIPDDTGGIGGYLDNSLIKNSYFTGTIKGDFMRVGGIVAKTLQSNIFDSYSTGDIDIRFNDAGGIGGLIMSTTIQNVYATGSVSADYNAGGLVGFFGSVRAAERRVPKDPIFVLYPSMHPYSNFQQVHIYGGVAANKSVEGNDNVTRLIGNGVPTSLSSSGFYFAGRIRNSYSRDDMAGTFTSTDLMLNGTVVPSLMFGLQSFYESAGWKFGDSYDAPWVMPAKDLNSSENTGTKAIYPYLYWEDHGDRRCVCPK